MGSTFYTHEKTNIYEKEKFLTSIQTVGYFSR